MLPPLSPRAWVLLNTILSILSASLCVSFSRKTKSERIMRIFSLKIPTTVHREKKKTIHSCPHCDKQFEIKKTMTYHMFNVHGDEKVAHFRLVLFLCHKIMRNFQVTYSLLISVRSWNFKDGGSSKASFLAKNQHATKEKSLKNSHE